MKMYLGKYCVDNFIEHTEDKVKQLYDTFSQQPMTELTNVLKREHKNVMSILKSLLMLSRTVTILWA